VSREAIRWAFDRGRLLSSAGRGEADVYFFGRQEIQDALADGIAPRLLEKLDGVIVVTQRFSHRVVTTYRQAFGRASRRRRRQDRQPHNRPRSTTRRFQP
jgi:hypothetical protein